MDICPGEAVHPCPESHLGSSHHLRLDAANVSADGGEIRQIFVHKVMAR